MVQNHTWPHSQNKTKQKQSFSAAESCLCHTHNSSLVLSHSQDAPRKGTVAGMGYLVHEQPHAAHVDPTVRVGRTSSGSSHPSLVTAGDPLLFGFVQLLLEIRLDLCELFGVRHGWWLAVAVGFAFRVCVCMFSLSLSLTCTRYFST